MVNLKQNEAHTHTHREPLAQQKLPGSLNACKKLCARSRLLPLKNVSMDICHGNANETVVVHHPSVNPILAFLVPR